MQQALGVLTPEQKQSYDEDQSARPARRAASLMALPAATVLRLAAGEPAAGRKAGAGGPSVLPGQVAEGKGASHQRWAIWDACPRNNYPSYLDLVAVTFSFPFSFPRWALILGRMGGVGNTDYR